MIRAVARYEATEVVRIDPELRTDFGARPDFDTLAVCAASETSSHIPFLPFRWLLNAASLSAKNHTKSFH